MTLQPLERDAVEHGDRYLAAYASVHSLLSDPDPLGALREPATTSAAVGSPQIPSARLAHSAGGRRKMKRRRFRSTPAAATATG